MDRGKHFPSIATTRAQLLQVAMRLDQQREELLRLEERMETFVREYEDLVYSDQISPGNIRRR